MKKTLYLSSWINFGQYRENPKNLKSIIDTEYGRIWTKWMIKNSHTFEFDNTVIKYLELQEEDARCVLQPLGSE